MDKRKLVSNIKIIRELSIRDLKLKYSSAFLGILWAGLIPLMLSLAIYFVFIKVLQVGRKDFIFFVLSGIVPWLYFSSAITESAQAFFQEKSMMAQFDFPKFFYPTAVNISNIYQHLIAWGFVLPLFIVPNFKIIIKIPFLVFPLIFLGLFLNGICIISAIINLLFRDFQHFLTAGLMILFWITPVFYSVDMVPDKFKFILYLNPLTYFLKMYRIVLLDVSWNKFDILVLSFWILFSIILAGFIYKKLFRVLEKKI